MKILHIIPNFKKGGAERLVLDICNELQKREGVKVKLITFTPDNEYKFLSKNIDWEVVPALVELSLVRKNNMQVEQLQKAIEDFNPDIIHSHLYEAEIISRSCLFPKAKWFTHCHSNMKAFDKSGKKLKQNIIYKFERNYLFNQYKINGGTNFIAISKNTIQFYKETIKQYPVTLLPNAIDYQQFYNQKEKTITNPMELINVGSIKPLKNQEFLIDVVANLNHKGIKVKLTILGDGESKKSLQEKVNQLELNSQVELIGNVDNVSEYLKKSHIYVHSCLSEALGLTLIEAMASGLPVVTLDGGGNRDLIIQGKNGYIFKKANVSLFADKIIEINNNPLEYEKMSVYAKEFAKKYDIKTYIDNLLELYRI